MRALRGETNFDFFLDFYHLDSKKCFHFAEKCVKRCEAQLMKAQGCDDKKRRKINDANFIGRTDYYLAIKPTT